MTIQVSAFKWVPPFAEGHVRDLRVRWALEEAGLPYEAVLIDQDGKNTPAYRAWQPFGQVPAYRDDEVELFESGAIVLHLASRSEALAPADAAGRARVATWVLCALNTLEPDFASTGRTRPVPPGRGLDGRAPAAARAGGAPPAGRARGSTRRPVLSRGPVHRRRHPHDHRPADGRACHARRVPDARRLPGAQRGPAGLRARARGSAAAVPRP